MKRVREHEDVEQFGAGSGAERVQAGAQAAFEFIRTHTNRSYGVGP